MKKGLRLFFFSRFIRLVNSNRRPDEEGIKTTSRVGFADFWNIPTADLMKKGLRPVCAASVSAAAIPTADLMKKGLRPVDGVGPARGMHSNRRPDEEGIKTQVVAPDVAHDAIPTADLMKKGLRLITHLHSPRSVRFQPQT